MAALEAVKAFDAADVAGFTGPVTADVLEPAGNVDVVAAGPTAVEVAALDDDDAGG